MSNDKCNKKLIEQRMCIGCRKVQHKSQMLRIVKAPSGEINLDLNGKSPGRGAYLCKDEQCLKAALKKRQLDRAFKTKVPSEVYDKIIMNYELGIMN